MRLGEILRHSGLITADHIDRAVRAQTGLGGRIGTNLVELGVVHPDQIAEALARQKGVAAARLKHFSQVHASTVKLLPKHLAERHNAIPIGMTSKFGRELVVAFLDPDDIAAVDEVGFAAGVRVRPSVAPEYYIIQYLERFYNVPPRRYLRTNPPMQAIDMDHGSGRVPTTAPEPVAADPHRPAAPRRARRSTVDSGWDAPAEDAAHAPAPAPAPAATLPPPPSPGPAASEPPRLLTGDEALAEIEAATTRDEVGDAIVGYLVATFGCGAVMICKKDAALGWRGYFPGVDADTVESITIALGVESAFRTAHDRRETYRGAAPDTGRDIQSRLWKHLHCGAPAEVVVAPIALRSRVINLVYAHAADGGTLPDGSGDRLPELCAAAADAFVRLIKAKKGG